MSAKILILLIAIIAVTNGKRIFPQYFEGRETVKLQTSVNADEVVNVSTQCNKLDDQTRDIYSGYMNVGAGNNSAVFFVFYPAMNKKQDAPIVMWLQGGPGCSSLIGAFTEFGPYNVTCEPDCKENKRDFSWNDEYHLLVIDQPVGTGYSYAATAEEMADTTEKAAEQLYNGLVSLYNLTDAPCNFAQYAKNDLHIFGESAAGHWIPGTAYKILKENEKDGFKIPLKTIGMGNPWTDPLNQNENGNFAQSVGLISQEERIEIERFELTQNMAILGEDWVLANNASGMATTLIQLYGGGVNVYNYRIFGDYNDSKLEKWLNETATMQYYQVVDNINYAECNNSVYNNLLQDNVLSQAWKMPYIFTQIPVMIYEGQDDIICNTPGQLNWLNMLDWPGNRDFFDSQRYPWSEKDEVVGMSKVGGNLTFVNVNKAGHMVPKDQLANSCAMLKRWVSGSGWPHDK